MEYPKLLATGMQNCNRLLVATDSARGPRFSLVVEVDMALNLRVLQWVSFQNSYCQGKQAGLRDLISLGICVLVGMQQINRKPPNGSLGRGTTHSQVAEVYLKQPHFTDLITEENKTQFNCT
jgi:hypothetical protein